MVIWFYLKKQFSIINKRLIITDQVNLQYYGTIQVTTFGGQILTQLFQRGTEE